MFSPHTCKWMCELQNTGLQNLLLRLYPQGCRAVLHRDSASQTFLLWEMKWTSHNLLYFTKLASFTNIFRDVSTKLSILSIQLSCFCFFWKPLLCVTFFSHLLVKDLSLYTCTHLVNARCQNHSETRKNHSNSKCNTTDVLPSLRVGHPSLRRLALQAQLPTQTAWWGWGHLWPLTDNYKAGENYWGFWHAKSKRRLKEVHLPKQ